MANNLNGLSGLYIGNRKVSAIYLGTYQQWSDDEPSNPIDPDEPIDPSNPIEPDEPDEPDEPIEIQNPATIHNQVGFDIVICPNSRGASSTDITLPGIYGGEKDIVVEKGTYTIKECVMSGIDIGQTTYKEGDTIAVNSDITISKHVYELPSGWDQELDEQYPIPQFDPDDPNEPDEPSESEYTGTQFTVQITDESNKTFYIHNGITLSEGSEQATIDWGDGTTNTYAQSVFSEITHTYGEVGTYNVRIDDNVSRFGISTVGFDPETNTNANMIVGDVKLGDKVVEIISFCFKDCKNITSITLPKNLVMVYRGALFGCLNLKNIISKAVAAPRLGQSAFGESSPEYQMGILVDNKTLTVPSNSTGYLDSEWETIVVNQLGYNIKYSGNDESTMTTQLWTDLISDIDIPTAAAPADARIPNKVVIINEETPDDESLPYLYEVPFNEELDQ